jgi:hypothetical protein
MTRLAAFGSTGAVALPKLLAPQTVELMHQVVLLKLANGSLPLEPGCADKHAMYGDPTVEALFSVVGPQVADVLDGAQTSYGYLRVYTAGSELPLHVDRVGCDYTLTLALGGRGAGACWPIWARGHDGANRSFELSAGDGVLLGGRDVPHWRMPLSDGWAAFAFLHWVSPGLPPFDGRPGLGFPSVRRS